MNPCTEGICSIVPSLARRIAVVCVLLAAIFGSLPRSRAQTAGFTIYGGPQSVAITAGTTQVLDVVVTPVGGFTGNVCVTVSGLPSGITFGTVTNSPNSCSPTNSFLVTAGIVAQITLSAPSTQSESVSQFTLSGAAMGYTTQTANVELTVSPTSGTMPTDYVLTTGVPAISLVTSAITKYTFTVNAAAANTNGFTGTISGTISGLPANVSASPATFTLTLGTPTDVTITAATGAALGNSVFTVGTTSGSGSSQIVHNMPVVLNIGTQAQSFQLSTPAAMSLTSSGTAVGYIGVTPINGFNGKVTLSLGTLPPGVTGVLSSSTIWPNTLTPDTGNQFQSLVTLTLTGGTFTGTTQNSITLTGTATGVATPPANTIVLTTSNAATNTVNATVQTSTTAAAFPSQFVGFSLSKTPFDAFTASSTATANFANLMKNFGPYVGLPLVRTQLESTNGSNVSALETDATYASDKLNFFFTESSAFNLGADQSEGSGMITNVGGSSQFFGAELDNEPDGYPGSSPDGLSGAAIRPASWTFADYLNELSSYKNDSLTGPYITAALAGSYWIPGIPALVTALGTGSGGIADFTLHRYAGCITPDQLLLDEYSHNYYHDRFAGLVKTLPSSVPVRSGEMNTSQCATVSGGGTAAGDTFAESLWMIDTAFELNAAGATGFNLHSEGAAGAPDTYDIAAVDGSGNITVRPPYYGTLFFAEAIQNGAQPLPVTIQQMSGNVKVWATIDSSNVIRVMVLEKDDDSSSKTIHLNLGSYSSTATQLTMSSSTGVSGNESHITIGGAAFNVTTSNGLLNGTPSTTNVTPALVSGSYIYSFTVNDGTATLLTIP